jgi:6-phosphofructokinase 1
MKIGVLTSGGDCAGLNAVIRAVTERAIRGYGWRVFGIEQATLGLLRRPVAARELTLRTFDGNLLRQGGTVLGTTNTGNPFAFPRGDGGVEDRSEEVIAGCRELGLDALVCIGGDGSLAILQRLAEQGGLNIVGIPKTIDNDVRLTENSIGYATAIDVATEALDRLQPTAASHSRVMVLEVMGRDAGHIAIGAGVAGGADVILIPEIPWRMAAVAGKIRRLHEEDGRNFALVVVAEAVPTEEGEPVRRRDAQGTAHYGGIGEYLRTRIAAETGAATRVTVLGHLQRGGVPVPRDRLFASAFGVHAVDLVAEGRFGRMVAWQNRQVVDVDLAEVVRGKQSVDPDGALVRTARGLGICLGDA